MKKLIVLMSLSTLVLNGVFAQNEVLMTIDNTKVTLEEFENIYKKNNNDPKTDKASLDEYLDLFVNFKLKVNEALALKMDTSDAFKNELSGYRKQLARPYLTDKSLDDKLVQEAYDRLKIELRASHLLLTLPKNPTPQDTLAVYNRILEIKKQIDAGADFGDMVAKMSEEPRANESRGDLKYFSAMQMVYPFESAAYSLNVGEVSNPVKTQFGYHLIKLTDKRTARGEVKIAHIMIRSSAKDNVTQRESAKRKITEIYDSLTSGGDFATFARKYSQDQSSSRKGGEINWFTSSGKLKGTNQVVISEFVDKAFELTKNDEVSKPFTTDFGWHVIKRIDRKAMASFEESKGDLKLKVNKDSRSNLSQKSFIKKLKLDYCYIDYSAKQFKHLYKLVDTSILNGNWTKPSSKKWKKNLYNLDNEYYPLDDFGTYLEKAQRPIPNVDLKEYINSQYRAYINKTVYTYENDNLENKYPDFKNLMQEYRDGILLFELTDKTVWKKAMKDSTGLEAFFAENKSNYQWKKRANSVIFFANDRKVINKAYNLVLEGNLNDIEILKELNGKSSLNLDLESGKFEIERHPYLKTKSSIQVGVTKPELFEDKYRFAKVLDIIPAGQKELKDTRGLVISDYQDHLEKEWVEELKNKYKVTVNKEVLYSISKN